MRERPDRIAKGAEIARIGRTHQHESGWTVESDSSPLKHYEVTRERTSCTCPDFAKNIGLCKHLWATAAPLALTVLEMREAETLDDLDRLYDEAMPRAAGLPRGFELSARHEYAKNFCRIEDEVDLSKAAARISTREKVSASRADLAARITERRPTPRRTESEPAPLIRSDGSTSCHKREPETIN